MYILTNVKEAFFSRILPKQKTTYDKFQEPSTKQDIYTYIIIAHGSMFSNYEKTYYFAIDIPENIELYTYTNIGNIFNTYCNRIKLNIDDACESRKEEIKNSTQTLFGTDVPIYKAIHETNQSNKFPEIFFTPDTPKPHIDFYSGIIHCIPHDIRDATNLKVKEIIYSIDAKNEKNCTCKEIPIHKVKKETYDCDKKYSKYYNEQLEKFVYDPQIPETKCGPILLSDAIKLIKEDCFRRYNKPDSIIKIYIHSCLDIKDINNYIEDIKDKINKWNTVQKLYEFEQYKIHKDKADVLNYDVFRYIYLDKTFDIITNEYFDNTIYKYILETEGNLKASETKKQKLQVKIQYYLENAINKCIEDYFVFEFKNSYFPVMNLINLIKFDISETGNIDNQIIKEIYKQLKYIIKHHNLNKQDFTYKGGRNKKTIKTSNTNKIYSKSKGYKKTKRQKTRSLFVKHLSKIKNK